MGGWVRVWVCVGEGCVKNTPSNPHPPTHPPQVAYGLNEEQMRRWGLYVSRPLGPDESIGLFAGGWVWFGGWVGGSGWVGGWVVGWVWLGGWVVGWVWVG